MSIESSTYELTKSKPPLHSQETFETKALREIGLAGEGLISIPLAAHDALYNHTAETAGKALLAGGMTAGLSLLGRAGAGPALGTALAISFASDIYAHGKEIVGAFKDNWDSDGNWNKNVNVMQNSVGRFSVDLAITSATGLATGRAVNKVSLHETPAELNSPDVERLLIPGQDVRVSIMSEGRSRKFDVHLPKNLDRSKKIDALLAFDGLSINEEPRLSGLSKQSDLGNFIAVYLHADTRVSLPGVKVSSWNSEGVGVFTPGKFPLGNPKYDDFNFTRDVISYLDNRFNVGHIGLAGFSEGGNMAMHLAGKLPKERLLGVASVNGTVFGTEAPPHPGLNAVIVLGDKDPTLPPKGGAGAVTRVLSWFGHDRVRNLSQPGQQALRLAESNGFSGDPKVISHGSVTETIYAAENTVHGGEVREYKIKDGGHAWPRLPSDGNEADQTFGRRIKKLIVSSINGCPSDFNVSEKIAQLIMGRNIERDLGPTLLAA